MKLFHLTLILFIFFSSLSQAKVNQLDDQDKQAVYQLVKNLADKLFLLETTQYQSKKLQKELLKLMPNKIAAESEYEPMSKKKYIYFSIKSGKHDKDIIYRRIRDDITPKCQYIKDGTIDCDLKERIKYIEKSNSIPKKLIEYVAGKEYKFNLKMNETGDWYINKMKTWNIIPAPRMSTLEIEEKYRQEELKNKRVKSNSKIRDKDENENDIFPTRATRRSDDVSRSRKRTDVELAEEEAEKEEQEQLFDQYQEQRRIQSKNQKPKILRYDTNGNVIYNNIHKDIKNLIKVCDKNHNNMVERSELLTQEEWKVLSKREEIICYFSEEELKSIDKNKDNILTEEEFLSTYKKQQMAIGYPMNDTKKRQIKKNIKKEIEAMKTLPKYIQLNSLFSLCNENDDYALTLDEAKHCKIDIDTFNNLDSDGNKHLDKNDTLMQLEEWKIFMNKHLD